MATCDNDDESVAKLRMRRNVRALASAGADLGGPVGAQKTAVPETCSICWNSPALRLREVDHSLRLEKDVQSNPLPAADWAHQAARGIIEELSDDRGSALEAAFHRERVPENVPVELVMVVAELIRQAYQAR